MPKRRRSARRERELADEGRYTCGACGEEIVVPIDASAGAEQSYVEDCPVCCRPHRIRVEVDEDGSVRVWAELE
ncbi:MAG: CPXCG motif-containing cysteine-rich protein [Planctomycetota bacterium]